MFDGTAVDNWWKSALVFKLFARSTGQKVVCIILNLPTLQIYLTIFTLLINWTKRILMYRAHSFFQPNQVGSCGIPLKSILKSDSFHLDSSLDIQENSISRPGSASRRGGSDVEGFYGKLKVGVQIVKRSFLKTVCKGQF